MHLENNKAYWSNFIKINLGIIGGVIIIQLLVPGYFLITFLLFLLLQLIVASEKYTHSIDINSQNIVIVYFHFFSKKELIVSNSEVVFKLLKQAAFRGGGYFVIDVFQENRKIYRIDSRDGFLKEDLVKLIEFQLAQEPNKRGQENKNLPLFKNLYQ